MLNKPDVDPTVAIIMQAVRTDSTFYESLVGDAQGN